MRDKPQYNSYAEFVNACNGRPVIASPRRIPVGTTETLTLSAKWGGCPDSEPFLETIIREASYEEYLACPWPTSEPLPEEGHFFYEVTYD